MTSGFDITLQKPVLTDCGNNQSLDHETKVFLNFKTFEAPKPSFFRKPETFGSSIVRVAEIDRQNHIHQS